MRNIVIACSLIITLTWLFFTTIFLESTDNASDPLEGNESQIEKKSILTVDIKNLALLLDVEYQEEKANANEVEAPITLEVEVGVVVIYTSDNNHKIRVRTLINNEKQQRDMVVGDSLYNYVLTAINPSSAELDNGENKIILKAFKNTVISVTDLPKELPESL
jgi:hypothetical protein